MKKKKKPSKIEVQADTYRVALDEFPEFAAQVGILISCFAMVESYVHRLIGKLTGTSEADAFVFSGSFLNFRPRVDLLETLARRRSGKLESVVAARHFVSTLREAAKVRNIYAHGQYSLTYEGGGYSPTAKRIIHIDTSLFSATRQPAKTVRDLDQVIQDVPRIKFIICELHAYIYRDEMPEADP